MVLLLSFLLNIVFFAHGAESNPQYKYGKVVKVSSFDDLYDIIDSGCKLEKAFFEPIKNPVANSPVEPVANVPVLLEEEMPVVYGGGKTTSHVKMLPNSSVSSKEQARVQEQCKKAQVLLRVRNSLMKSRKHKAEAVVNSGIHKRKKGVEEDGQFEKFNFPVGTLVGVHS